MIIIPLYSPLSQFLPRISYHSQIKKMNSQITGLIFTPKILEDIVGALNFYLVKVFLYNVFWGLLNHQNIKKYSRILWNILIIPFNNRNLSGEQLFRTCRKISDNVAEFWFFFLTIWYFFGVDHSSYTRKNADFA